MCCCVWTASCRNTAHGVPTLEGLLGLPSWDGATPCSRGRHRACFGTVSVCLAQKCRLQSHVQYGMAPGGPAPGSDALCFREQDIRDSTTASYVGALETFGGSGQPQKHARGGSTSAGQVSSLLWRGIRTVSTCLHNCGILSSTAPGRAPFTCHGFRRAPLIFSPVSEGIGRLFPQ
jgi:hypothetical protein